MTTTPGSLVQRLHADAEAWDCPDSPMAYTLRIEREAAAELERQAREIEELRKDAERYRWLRSQGLRHRKGGAIAQWVSGEQADFAIDEAKKP